LRALAAGAKPLRQPEKTDPDGHVWEVVRAPDFKFDADGALILPD
jgi:hypothetical protein